ncbi:putative membrane protein [Burkholderia pseudomallei MSHR7343]|nr:putative membrane protein [Burkholderia pseudomallei MSHR7343]KGS37754.1 putative membrane protein [Burkholderia pseudomallei ABCPW 107]
MVSAAVIDCWSCICAEASVIVFIWLLMACIWAWVDAASVPPCVVLAPLLAIFDAVLAALSTVLKALWSVFRVLPSESAITTSL